MSLKASAQDELIAIVSKEWERADPDFLEGIQHRAESQKGDDLTIALAAIPAQVAHQKRQFFRTHWPAHHSRGWAIPDELLDKLAPLPEVNNG